MNKLLTSFAAAMIGFGLLSTAANAGSVSPSQQEAPASGVVIVPASANAGEDAGDAAAFRRGKIVDFGMAAEAGDIIINTKQNRLHFVLGWGRAVWSRGAPAKKGLKGKGAHAVSARVRGPDWRPPQAMRQRRPELPEFMAGGPKNPLGARAIYLGSSIYRIHGTNEPSSIGKAASSGCIRMLNEDVSELYRHVRIGARVTVL